MQFNNEEFKRFRRAIKSAVSEVEKEFGVEVEFGNIKYDNNSFTIATKVLNGSKDEASKKIFEGICHLYNLKKEDFGREFLMTESGVKAYLDKLTK